MIVTVNGSGLKGQIPAIASKSMAHRLLICAALSGEPTKIRCETLSEDIRATANCLRAMGAQISYTEGAFYVNGGNVPPKTKLNCGESASTLRFLLPVVCALGISCAMERMGRLPTRPLAPLDKEMTDHGAKIDNSSETLVVGGKLRSGTYTIRADISSQYISGLLFALPMLSGDSEIKLTGNLASASYVDMTLFAIRAFGIKIEERESGYYIPGGQKYVSPGVADVEGDWSGAAFWLCAKELGAPLTVTGLKEDSLQGDRAVVCLLEKLKGEGKVLIDAENVPDLVPILTVFASARKGQTVIYNAARLRLKESDRLTCVRQALEPLGAKITETEDGLKITGTTLHGGKASSFGDHRIAMSLAIASVVAGDVTIEGAEACAKSYPAFWEDFKRLGGKVIFN